MKNILKTLISVVLALVILFLMDLLNFNTQGLNNFFGTLDSLGLTFINIYNNDIYNIFASLIVILFVIYVLYISFSKLMGLNTNSK